jgi:hypothetical protein
MRSAPTGTELFGPLEADLLASLELLGDRLNAKLERRQDATQALKNYALFAQPLCHFLEIIMIDRAEPGPFAHDFVLPRCHRGLAAVRKSNARDTARVARL